MKKVKMKGRPRPRAKTARKPKSYAMRRNFSALGEYLQDMRIRAELTQRDVSERLGYSSAQFISNFERGISAPPMKKLRDLIEMYRMPMSKVMDLILEGERQGMLSALRSSESRR